MYQYGRGGGTPVRQSLLCRDTSNLMVVYKVSMMIGNVIGNTINGNIKNIYNIGVANNE